MIIKLIILFIFTGIISVNTRKITEPVEESNKNEYMSYGWRVTFPREDGYPINYCYGTFIAPRVFITDAWCVLRHSLQGDLKQLFIIKSYHDYSNNGNNTLSVNVTNIYYHEDLSSTYDINKRQIGVLITNEPVNSEIDKNGYIQLNSNLYDINTTSCFVPSYDSWDITYTTCEVAYYEFGNSNNVYCLSRGLSKSSGNAFICHLKMQPDVKVLVGILSEYSDITEYCGNSGFKLSVIENVSGLSKLVTEKVQNLL